MFNFLLYLYLWDRDFITKSWKSWKMFFCNILSYVWAWKKWTKPREWLTKLDVKFYLLKYIFKLFEPICLFTMKLLKTKEDNLFIPTCWCPGSQHCSIQMAPGTCWDVHDPTRYTETCFIGNYFKITSECSKCLNKCTWN